MTVVKAHLRKGKHVNAYMRNAGYADGRRNRLGGHIVIYNARAQGLRGGRWAVMHEPSSLHIVVHTKGHAKEIMEGVSKARSREEAARYADILPKKR